ncbi:cob(I)yrinic acid a,c-diamide adenosyltransferase [Oleiharenicola sp. Vm1]|uniref:cob(I)yrinic acid a,c-diamide adenosyltransferase n=1 Tax=Oleiharenicola sp. Vm1 TaxID=3398393 RepID=UPI0039F48E2C
MAEAGKAPARSIATRTGDDGSTSLLYGQRVPKHHPQIEAVGALDELNAALGFAKATQPAGADRAELERIQQELVAFMGEIACAEADAGRYAASKFSQIDAAALARLDAAVAAIEARQPKFDGWATPGANLHAAALELARTAARRAERRVSGLAAGGKTVRPLLLQYLNRASDLLWLLAREAESR